MSTAETADNLGTIKQSIHMSRPAADQLAKPPGKLIVVVSGKKMAGKNTFGNLVAAEFINKKFNAGLTINKLGNLVSSLSTRAGTVERGISLGEPDRSTAAQEFGVRVISFADALKNFCVNVLGLTVAQCYGTDMDKRTPTHIQWESMPREVRMKYSNQRRRLLFWKKVPRTGPMTARDVMQCFGSEIVRAMYKNAWVRACYALAMQSKDQLILICDARFPNEVIEGWRVSPKVAAVRTVRLLREVAKDLHESETAMDNAPLHVFDLVGTLHASVDDYRHMVQHEVQPWFYQAGILN